MINNEEILIVNDSLLMINSKNMYNYLPPSYPEEYISRPMMLKLSMYNGFSIDPKIYLFLHNSNNVCTQYLQ